MQTVLNGLIEILDKADYILHCENSGFKHNSFNHMVLTISLLGHMHELVFKPPYLHLQEIFSLDELRLPPIPNKHDKKGKETNVMYKTTLDTKPLKLPVVHGQPLHKTFTTRKGALLLYSENYFLPGSPKGKKRRRKLKKQSAGKLKTLTDLRDFILNYKRNGVSVF